MAKYVIKVGDFRTTLKFYTIGKLCYLGNNFTTVYIDKVKCTGIDVAKRSAPYKVGFDNVAVVQSTSGDVFYYHPKYRRWYKNLSSDSLKKYFFWLIPVRNRQ